MKTRVLIIAVIATTSILSLFGITSQIDIYDYGKYYTVFGSGSPLVEIGTGNPLLSKDNCDRYAYWLSEHQKEKITIQEDFSVRYPPWGNQIFPLVEYCMKMGQLEKTVTDDVTRWEFQPVRQGMQGLPSEPEPEPVPIPDSESLQRQKQQQAKLDVQKWVLTDTRDRVNQINAIREYRDKFESGYFLEQFIHPIKQNYEKDKLMNFIYGEWGFQPTENTSPKVTVYFRSYENYDKIEKINEWQKPKDDASIAISHDPDGFLLMGLHGMPPATGIHEACVIPGEYRVSASNPNDESKVEWGYFTCQRDKLVGEAQPWMELPE